MAEFTVDPRIEAASVWIGELSLCQVRLQKDARFPWLVLLPRRAGLTELTELSEAEHAQLRADLHVAEQMVRRAAEVMGQPVSKLNIANLGNIVAQLHIHVIARHPQDAAWPGPVWGFGTTEAFAPAQKAEVVEALKSLIPYCACMTTGVAVPAGSII